MEEDYEWVLVKQPNDRDAWSPSLSPSNSEATASSPLEIRFNEPAKHWTDALPIGNGRLGAMVWGGVPSEILNLNEDTLWTGNPGDYTNPTAPKLLSEVRKLVDDEKYVEATEAAVQLSGNPSEMYQLLGDVKIDFDDSHAKYVEETYHSLLDLDTATATVKYSVDEVEYTREYFVSNPDQAIVARISGNKPGCLSFTLSLDSKLQHYAYVNGKSQIVMQGSCPGKRNAPKENSNDDLSGIQFSAVLDLQISDNVGALNVLDDKKLQVEGCDWAIMIVVASSSFDGPFTKPSDSKRDPSSEALSRLNSIKKFSYSELYARHLNDYQNLFRCTSLKASKVL